jgi:hypothetical protein
MEEAASQEVETINDPKLVFEKQQAEFKPDYSDLKNKAGYFAPFAEEMERIVDSKMAYEDAMKFKNYRLPVMEGLPIVVAMCLVYEDEAGNPMIMLKRKEYIDPEKTMIHEDIYDSWEAESKQRPESENAKLFKKLRPRGTGLAPIHGYVVESTEGRQLILSDNNSIDKERVGSLSRKAGLEYGVKKVIDGEGSKIMELSAADVTNMKYLNDNISSLKGIISDRSLRIYKNLAEKLYLKHEETIDRDSQKWNFVKDMEKIADNVRNKKLFGIDPPNGMVQE